MRVGGEVGPDPGLGQAHARSTAAPHPLSTPTAPVRKLPAASRHQREHWLLRRVMKQAQPSVHSR
eukprot:3570105-Rhodomonas_salina.2